MFCHFYKIKVMVTTTYGGQSNTSVIENLSNVSKSSEYNRLKIDMAIDQICLHILIKQEAYRSTIVYLSTFSWKETCLYADNERPEKHKFGGGRWVLASCQDLLNSIQRFQTRSRKILSKSEAWRPS